MYNNREDICLVLNDWKATLTYYALCNWTTATKFPFDYPFSLSNFVYTFPMQNARQKT